MSTQTTHLKLDLREASDIFNPLSTNANFESLDNIIYEIQKKGGVPTFTTTASANLLKLSENPTPNSTVFKFVAAGDANTWSFSETINDIVALDGSKKTVKGGDMYVAWVNSANAMVVIAWPDVVNAQTFDGKGPNEWATAAQLQAVNTAATNATQTAQAAATVANNALAVANAAGMKMTKVWEAPTGAQEFTAQTVNLTNVPVNTKLFVVVTCGNTYKENLLNKRYCNILLAVPGIEQGVVYMPGNVEANPTSGVEGWLYGRNATISSALDAITFTRAMAIVYSGKVGSSPNYCDVPMEIYALS